MTDFTLKKEVLQKALNGGAYPRYLFKYRDDSKYTESIFEDLALWFSAPQSFNDPFDCNLSEVSSHTQEEANKFLEHILEGRPDRDTLLSQGTTVTQAENYLAGSKDSILSKTGILCLSQEFDSILMWSHYTNSHKGLVIELDLTQDLDFFLSPIRVKYEETYVPTNYFMAQKESVTKIISTKSRCWSYEKEVRIMKINQTGKIKINPKAIKRVIFGCKAEPDFVSRIKNLCSRPELQHVVFNQLKPSYAKFALEFTV
jgi:hypothetical protein